MSPDEQAIFTVETLIKYMGDDAKARAVVVKIVSDAVSTGHQPLEQAGAAVDEGRYADAASLLHGLRGSVGTLGAKRFVGAAFALELAIAEQRYAEVDALFARADAEFRLALEHANNWLAQQED